MQFRTPRPEVTADSAAWQIASEPIVVAGLLYNATREMRMFDGQVMTQIDVYQRVPIYADTTREPFTIVYVPLSSDRMRAYERAPASQFTVASGRGAAPLPPPVVAPVTASEEVRAVGTTGTIAPFTPSRQRRTAIESIPRPRGTNGVWVEFNGTRWYSEGAATSYSPDRFTRVGDYHGFPVYRARANNQDVIWIPVVEGGPVAPYARR